MTQHPHLQQPDEYYPLARERVGVWIGHLAEGQAVLSAADAWVELYDLLHARGWHNVTPALVASMAPHVELALCRFTPAEGALA